MQHPAILLTLLCLSGTAFAQTKNFIDQPYLETIATADTAVTPDRIYLSITLTEKDTKGRISVEELENKMAEKLESLGVDLKKQLMLADAASNFKKYFLKQQDVMKSKNFTLLVYDAQSAGKVIAGLEEIEISNVTLDKTEYSKMESLILELKTKAVAKAEQQGKALLAPLHQKLGSALLVTDQQTNAMAFLDGRMAGIVSVGYSSSKDRLDRKPIAVDFEKIKVVSTVEVKFRIEE